MTDLAFTTRGVVLRIPAGLRLPDDRAAGAVEPTCRVCGCTQDRACPGGCGWETADRDLCTACADRVWAIVSTAARRAFAREDNANVLTLAFGLAVCAGATSGPARSALLATLAAALADRGVLS